MKLPHLPLLYWNHKSLQIIGNSLGKYIDQAARKDQYSCARICVEVDLEEGLLEAIKLTVARWSDIQELDYEKIHFKCTHYHGYGHFARYCKKKAEEQSDKSKGEQRTSVQKNGHAKAAGKGPNKGNNLEEHGNEKRNPQAQMRTQIPKEALHQIL